MIPARRLTVPLLAVLAAILAAALLVACGSDDKSPSSAEGILKDTFGPGKSIRSGKLDLAVTFNATGLAGLNQPLKLAFSGPFQSQGGKTLPAFDFSADLGLSGTSLKAGTISTGKKGYLSFQGTPYELTPELYKSLKDGYGQSTNDNKDNSGPSFGSLGIDPVRWLKAPKIVGPEKIGDADTTHVTATVDVPKLLVDVNTLLKKAGKVGGAAGQAAGQVPSNLTEKQRKLIADSVKAASFDVWAGKQDGILRKLDIKVGFDVPAASRADAPGGLKTGSLQIGVTINELNKKQTIDTPKSARPFSELQGALGQLLGGVVPGASGGQGSGGAESGGSSSGGSSSGSGATPSAPQSAYVKCLQTAGQDIAKQNDCAKLLNR